MSSTAVRRDLKDAGVSVNSKTIRSRLADVRLQAMRFVFAFLLVLALMSVVCEAVPANNKPGNKNQPNQKDNPNKNNQGPQNAKTGQGNQNGP
ncbi:hypothetical protein TNCV_2983561 [Trichonephila clavipes]|nr:hypothetical protein TNCV_2983561 [Trichonephila clavipes]